MSENSDLSETPAGPAPETPPALTEEPAKYPVTPPSEVKNWAVFTHLSALSMFLGIPAGNIIGPLVIWLIKRDSIPEIDEHGKEALNFQITMLLALIISIPLTFVIIGFFTLIATMIVQLIFTIIAGVKASEGIAYRYPMSIRFIS